MKERLPCTIDLDWFSTISTTISTSAWKRPGTPEVARRAALYMKKQPMTPITMDQKTVS